MHFISINVLLAQDQKDGGNLNFLMKVISYSFLPHPRGHAARLENERESLPLRREMSQREKERLSKSACKSVSLGMAVSDPSLAFYCRSTVYGYCKSIHTLPPAM